MAHRRDSDVAAAFPALVMALESVSARLGIDQATTYHDLVKAVMSEAVRDEWRKFMTTTAIPRAWFSEDNQQAHERGFTRSKAEDLLMVLEVRGVAVDEEVRERILGTEAEDIDQLIEWLRRAVTADSIADVFG
ncbi:MAG: hypothetical protein QM621_01180 [Aeromicrobium sp.]|uniref:hypothetical protein n=1 Tax=Aeromicrobium sp. TaxID=1871063 RepID=UPI0039E2D552